MTEAKTEAKTAVPQRSLVKKLAEVMAIVERLPKTGKNDFHGYKFVEEANVVEAVRGEMAKRSLIAFPSVKSRDVRTVTSNNGKQHIITSLAVEFTLEDGDSGETRAVTFWGEAQDDGDKGSNKCMTAAEKFFLLKLFMIPTGDDTERPNDLEREAMSAPAPKIPTPRHDEPAPMKQNAPVPPRPATNGGDPTGGATFPFGKSKGQPVFGAPVATLEYFANSARRALADQSKAKFHAKERASLAMYEAELQRQRAS